MTTATYFPVTGTYASFSPGVALSGQVLFEPMMLDGTIITATLLTPNTGFIPFPVAGRIQGGVLTAVDGSGISLMANASLGITGSLYYRVSFANVTATSWDIGTNVVLSTQSVEVQPFSFQAPTDSSGIDLITVTPSSSPLVLGSYPAPYVAVPSSNSASGVQGQVASDSSYFYVCIASNSWKRTPLSTW